MGEYETRQRSMNDHEIRQRFDLLQESLNRIERHTHDIIRRVSQMAISEQEFDAALTDFVMSLDAGLTAIQAKLDAMGVGSDFTDELQTLSDAKTRLTDFVAANTAVVEEPPVEEPPVEEPPVEEPPVV